MTGQIENPSWSRPHGSVMDTSTPISMVRVLLAEDSPSDARLVQEMFRECGSERFELIHTTHLAMALTLLEREKFTVMLLDLSLPDSTDLDGLEQAQAKAPGLPIVVLTGQDNEALASRALALGAQDYLVKGKVTPDSLTRTLRYAIERKNAAQMLRESERRYRDLFEESLGLICTHDKAGFLLSINPAGAKILGYPPDSLIGRNLREFLAPRFHQEFDSYLKRIQANNSDSGLLAILDRAQQVRILAYKNVLHRDPLGTPYVIGYAQDITAQHHAETALKKSEDVFRTLAAHAPAGIFLTNTDGDWHYANARWCRMTGLTPEQTNGRGWLSAIHGDDLSAVLSAWQAAIKSGGEFAIEYRLRASEEKIRWVSASAAARRNHAGKVTGYVGTVVDISARKKNEEQLRALSLTDELTGLHNRRGFLSAAQQNLFLAKRASVEVALIYIDLDNMKGINDNYGHDEGDRALRTVASILRQVFRESDVLARIGGDEFVVLHLDSSGDTQTAQARLHQTLTEVNDQRVLPYALTMSVGMVHQHPDANATLEELLISADAQMYEIKHSKRRAR